MQCPFDPFKKHRRENGVLFTRFQGEPTPMLLRYKDVKKITMAAEEFVRMVSPLTHIGRTSTKETEVDGHSIPQGRRVSLCWASANFDETIFEAPEEVRLDRKPNPHIAYGSGVHNCLGAFHARSIIRTLLSRLCDHVESIQILKMADKIEREEDYERKVGYEELVVSFVTRNLREG